MSDFLLEIGCEEIPASFVGPALADMTRIFKERLAAERLTCGETATFGTPRRLTLLARGLADRTPDEKKEVMGPPAKVAFDPAGKPTKAAEKFAQGQGLSVEKLVRVQTPKGEYVAARVEEKGKTAEALLQAALPDVVKGISFKKSMRWCDDDVTFARPIRWIVALHGSRVIPFRIGDVESGRSTRGHRFLAGSAVELRDAGSYVEAMRKGSVQVDIAARRQSIADAAERAAKEAGGSILRDDELLDTVTELVEWPSAIRGSFDAKHLDLPREVLVSEMRGHQKYFSVVDARGGLLPHFVAVSNMPVKDPTVARSGYERVLRARLADARFFFDEDRKRPLASRVDDLKRVVFQYQLGTSFEKVERFRSLALWLARQVGAKDPATVERVATLAKADLTTGMVGEFPELQGVMGREYARGAGEKEEVATGIFEHYLPRNAADELPKGDAGALVGLADRLDTLVGIFGIGKDPTGAADPYGLRRACLAVITVSLHKGYRFSLSASVAEALKGLGPKVKDAAGTQAKVLEFFRGRLKAMWSEGLRPDVVEAVLASGFDDLVAARKRLDALVALVGRPGFEPLAEAFKRVVNIVAQAGGAKALSVDPKLFSEEPEKALHLAFGRIHGTVERLLKSGEYPAALKEIAGIQPAVADFLGAAGKGVRVMVDDAKVRENRLRLLADIGALFAPIADFGKIQGESAAAAPSR
jgi:glycyl-tRNA synthetase beta chain